MEYGLYGQYFVKAFCKIYDICVCVEFRSRTKYVLRALHKIKRVRKGHKVLLVTEAHPSISDRDTSDRTQAVIGWTYFRAHFIKFMQQAVN